MSFKTVIKKYFPVVYTEADFVEKTYKILNKSGFDADNTIASVDVCRDEISQPFVTLIKNKWGEAFNLCSLAAMFFAGKTALKAAMHHAPVANGKERYVFYALPHIAIGANGQLGVCKRIGRTEDSNACGALNVFLNELKGGRSNISMDNEDIELSLIRSRLLSEIPYGQVPDLFELTRTVQKVIQQDLEKALHSIVDTKKCDYSLVTGIQVHTPDGNYIWATDFYSVINGEKQKIKMK